MVEWNGYDFRVLHSPLSTLSTSSTHCILSTLSTPSTLSSALSFSLCSLGTLSLSLPPPLASLSSFLFSCAGQRGLCAGARRRPLQVHLHSWSVEQASMLCVSGCAVHVHIVRCTWSLNVHRKSLCLAYLQRARRGRRLQTAAARAARCRRARGPHVGAVDVGRAQDAVSGDGDEAHRGWHERG